LTQFYLIIKLQICSENDHNTSKDYLILKTPKNKKMIKV